MNATSRLTLAVRFTLALVAAVSFEARAVIVELPPSLAPDMLSETVPFAFNPNGFTVDDYRLEWQGPAVPGVSFHLGLKSLEWVRVMEMIDLPRAVAVFEVRDAEGGRVSHAGFDQPLAQAADGTRTATLPVAMISGPQNPIDIKVLRHGHEVTGRLLIRLAPRPENPPVVLFDSTCSHYGVEATVNEGMRPDEFVMVGCRLVRTKGEQYRFPSLELYIYWDGAGPTVEVGGVATPQSSVNLWAVRALPRPGRVELAAGKHHMVLTFHMPERFHKISLGVGTGPYAYTYQSPEADVSQMLPLLTLYGAYSFSETLRFATFNATAPHRQWFTDQGLYLWAEQMRVFDSRFSMALFFGFDVLAFNTGGHTHFRIAGPQGFEFAWRDFFGRGYDVSVGAFIAPKISNDQFYYNIWLRWGPPLWFVEFNYLSWQEELGGGPHIHSRSMGISVGFPLIQLL
ncbi:MAG TPA: hypothetical protein VL588_01500 [Bdellovibrionota bacterium]|nr:hypothetical protein [Bdellovibrionota bacterium]